MGGPHNWAAVSTPVLDMMRKEGHIATFKSALTGCVTSFVSYSFVDDTDLVNTGENTDSHHVIAQKMQDSITAWEGGIRATGGAFEPSKSHWYLVYFLWSAGIWRYAKIKETKATINMRDTTGTYKPIERLEVTEARRTLGVRTPPDGIYKTEQQYLTTYSNEWAANIREGHLPRHLVWQSLLGTLLKKIEYP